MSEDSFKKLFSNEKDLDKALITELLLPLVKLTPEGNIYPTPKFTKLKNEKRILVILLARKVLSHELKMEEETTPTKIAEYAGMSIGSVKPTIRKLHANKYVHQNKKGYFIPNHALFNIKEVMK